MTYKTAVEVLESEYTHSTDYKLGQSLVNEGVVCVMVATTQQGYDVWNKHPLRKGWQKVYSLSSCNPEEQVIQSLQSLKRLFEKE